MSVATTVGITFAITLIISILFTLLIVYIVYKIKQSTSNKLPPVGAVVSTAPLPRGDTSNDDYEYPEDYKTPPLQPNPAYGMEVFDKNNIIVNENFK